MENILHGNIRPHIAKGENGRLRKSGRIPAVVYGLKESSMLVEFAELDVYDVIKKAGEHGIIDIDINGKSQKSIIKEVQRDPVTKKIIHMDLQRIKENEKIRAKIPVVLKGEENLRGIDAIAQIEMDEIEVECMPDKLLSHITIDVSHMHPGQKVKVKDLELGEEITVLEDLNAQVAAVIHIKDHTSQTETPQEIEVVYQQDITP